MQVLTVVEILDKGLQREESLSEIEWPIYIVAYFESIMNMEGWDHFFTHNMKWLPQLKKFLSVVGDFESMKVIQSYKKHFEELGIHFSTQEIEAFLAQATDEYLDNCPDWCEQFDNAYEHRWELICKHYNSLGITVKT